MAQFEITGLDELVKSFNSVGTISESAKRSALEAMGDVAAKKIRQTGLEMNVFDNESDAHVLDSIKIAKPKLTKSGGTLDINFSGTRTRDGIRTRNAEIAFVNEYGKTNQAARPFIGRAMTENADQINAAGAEKIGNWIENEFKK